jgi:hypothetical protein
MGKGLANPDRILAAQPAMDLFWTSRRSPFAFLKRK